LNNLAIPVPSENVKPAELAILAEYPNKTEEELGKPLAGSAGHFFKYIFSKTGTRRADFPILHTLLCKPPKTFKPDQWRDAIEACKPRLIRELEAVQPNVIFSAGVRALEVSVGLNSVIPWYGSPLLSTLPITAHIFPSVHPGFVTKQPAFYPVFERWFKTAIDLSTGVKRPFKWGRLVTKPPYGPALVELAMEAQNGTPISVDIENNPETSVIRCIGVGTSKLAVSLPMLEQEYQGYPKTETGDLLLLRHILASDAPKIFHNFQHDVAELREIGYEINGTIEDTLLMHTVIAPRLRHRLTDVAAFEMHAERWKTKFGDTKDDKGAEEDKTKRFTSAPLDDLLPYNAKDVQGTAILYNLMRPQVDRVNNGEALYREKLQLEDLALRMRQRGIQVDINRFDYHQKSLNEILENLRDQFRTTYKIPAEYSLGANGQHPSLAKLFFETFGLQPFSYSESTGKPTLDGKALQRFAGTQSFPADIARLVLKYRKNSKLLTTYINKLRVQLDLDHVAHPRWRSWGTRTGRWAAYDPPLQTIPKPKHLDDGMSIQGLRDLFCARDGLWMVEGDYQQMEVRIAAVLSGDEKLLEWFATGQDVYTMTAMEIWKKEWSGFNNEAKKLRRFLSKKVVLGQNYGAGAETIWRSVIIDVPTVKLEAIQYVVDQRAKTHVKLVEWQEAQKVKAAKEMYVEAPLSGRRQHYHDGRTVPTEVLNYPIQATAGDIMNRAILQLDKAIRWGQEGILAQVHDAAIIEGPDPDRLVSLLHEHMEQEVELNGSRIKFKIDVKVGRNWADMKEIK
jgi:uracil-DNA glycosylase family 4